MVNRRKLLVALSATLFTPRAAFTQATKPPVVIGWLGVGSPTAGRNLAAFKEGLAALGWKEGTQYVIEQRWAENDVDRLPALADELVKRKPAILVAGSATAVSRLHKAAPDIPIVQVSGTSPVHIGLAKSLARPGGMVTGMTNLAPELSEKLIELLVEVAPKAKRVGVLIDGNFSNRPVWLDASRRSASHYAVEPIFAYPARAEEIEAAITALAKQGAQALVVIASPFFNAHAQRSRIITLAQAQRWPIVSWSRAWVEQGALISYGVDAVQSYRRAAFFVDRILKGAKPGDLPIEQPMTFELAVNMNSAKALGLTIPPTIMVRATHVIQ